MIACVECVAILVCYAAYCILPPLRIVFEVITTAAANSSHVPRTNPKTSLVLEASTRATRNIFLTGFSVDMMIQYGEDQDVKARDDPEISEEQEDFMEKQMRELGIQ